MLSTTTAKLEVGDQVPDFTLQALDGRTISRAGYRGRRHLLLIFFAWVDQPGRDFLQELGAGYSSFQESAAEPLAIVADSSAHPDGLSAALDLPFPVLLDPERKATGRYLPDGASHGLFIVDRYATLHAQWALTAMPFPPVSEILEWLTVIESQCSL